MNQLSFVNIGQISAQKKKQIAEQKAHSTQKYMQGWQKVNEIREIQRRINLDLNVTVTEDKLCRALEETTNNISQIQKERQTQ